MKRSTYTLRRLLALVLVLVMVGSLFAGCSKKANDPTLPEEPSETNAATVAPTDEATEAPTEEPTEAPTEPVETVPPVLMGTVNADNLNVRSEPYSTADILKRLAINTRIEILEQKIVDGVNWGRIAEGWINLNYVTIGVEFPGSDTNTDNNTVVNNQTNIGSGSVTTNNTTTGVTTTGLNIRKDSNASATAVGSYAKGTKVTILERSNGWGRTDKGWINLEYVDFSGKTTATSTGSSSSGTNSSTVSNGNSVPLGNGTVVKTTSLAIRSGPGANYTQVSYIRMGETHDYFQTSTNGWVRLKKGWVNADYLELEYYVESGTEVTVTTNELTVREEANYNSNKLYAYEKGDEITILEVKGTWGMVEYTSGQYGWVDLDKVKLPTPVASNYSTGVATITADALHIREKASASSDSLGIYEKGDKVDVLEVKGNWGRTEDGWINLKYTKMTTVYSTGTGYITASKLNVRALPDEDSSKIGSLSNGDKVVILDTEDNWGKILYNESKGLYGWISLKYVKLTSTSTGGVITSGTKFSVTIPRSDNGTVTASSTSCKKDTVVTLTAKPATGYKLSSFYVVDANGTVITVTDSKFTMPAANVTVTATFVVDTTPSTTYSVTCEPATNGSVSASLSSGIAQGTKVALTVTPADKYVLSTLTIKDSAGNKITPASDYSFTMPASNVTVTATFVATTGTAYAIGVDPSIVNGSLSRNLATAAKGTTVTLTATPDTGYQVNTVTVTAGGNSVTVSGSGNTRTFVMPESAVTVSATFIKTLHKVTVSSVTGGTASVDTTSCGIGTPVTVVATPAADYSLSAIKIYGPNNELVDTLTVSGLSFSMPAYDVTVVPVFEQNAHSIAAPTVNAGGTATVSPASAKAGETVTLTLANADDRFKVESVTVKAGSTVITVNGTGNTRTFTMPAANVTEITVKYVAIGVYKAVSGAKLRATASADGELLADVAAGTDVYAREGSTADWIKTNVGGKVGYIHITGLTKQ